MIIQKQDGQNNIQIGGDVNLMTILQTDLEKINIVSVDDFLDKFVANTNTRDWMYIRNTWIYIKNPFIKMKIIEELDEPFFKDLSEMNQKPEWFFNGIERGAFSIFINCGGPFIVSNLKFFYYDEEIYDCEVVNIHGKLYMPSCYLWSDLDQLYNKKIFEIINTYSLCTEARLQFLSDIDFYLNKNFFQKSYKEKMLSKKENTITKAKRNFEGIN